MLDVGVRSNPRHVPFTDEQTQEMRRKVESVVVDGADFLSFERERTMATREVTTAHVSSHKHNVLKNLGAHYSASGHNDEYHAATNPASTAAVLRDVSHHTSLTHTAPTSQSSQSVSWPRKKINRLGKDVGPRKGSVEEDPNNGTTARECACPIYDERKDPPSREAARFRTDMRTARPCARGRNQGG